MSDSADDPSKSASKKSAKFDDNHMEDVREFRESTKTDAAEEASDTVESPKKKCKVVSYEKATIKAKKDAEKAEKAAEKAKKEAERQAEKEDKAELARQRKALNEQKKILKQKIAEKARWNRQCRKRRRSARPATRTKMLWPLQWLASSFSREELEKMVLWMEWSETLDGMVKDGDKTADGSSHSGKADSDSGEADSSDDDI